MKNIHKNSDLPLLAVENCCVNTYFAPFKRADFCKNEYCSLMDIY